MSALFDEKKPPERHSPRLAWSESRHSAESCSQCRTVALSCPKMIQAGTKEEMCHSNIIGTLLNQRSVFSVPAWDEFGPKVTFVIPSSGGDLSLYSVLDSDITGVSVNFI